MADKSVAEWVVKKDEKSVARMVGRMVGRMVERLELPLADWMAVLMAGMKARPWVDLTAGQMVGLKVVLSAEN